MTEAGNVVPEMVAGGLTRATGVSPVGAAELSVSAAAFTMNAESTRKIHIRRVDKDFSISVSLELN